MKFIAHHPKADPSIMGFIPAWLNDDSPLPAKEQLHIGYRHGGGWQPFKGFTLADDDSLTYPGDPPQHPICEILLDNNERVVMYPSSWVAIIQPDRSYEVCRMD